MSSIINTIFPNTKLLHLTEEVASLFPSRSQSKFVNKFTNNPKPGGRYTSAGLVPPTDVPDIYTPDFKDKNRPGLQFNLPNLGWVTANGTINTTDYVSFGYPNPYTKSQALLQLKKFISLSKYQVYVCNQLIPFFLDLIDQLYFSEENYNTLAAAYREDLEFYIYSTQTERGRVNDFIDSCEATLAFLEASSEPSGSYWYTAAPPMGKSLLQLRDLFILFRDYPKPNSNNRFFNIFNTTGKIFIHSTVSIIPSIWYRTAKNYYTLGVPVESQIPALDKYSVANDDPIYDTRLVSTVPCVFYTKGLLFPTYTGIPRSFSCVEPTEEIKEFQTYGSINPYRNPSHVGDEAKGFLDYYKTGIQNTEDIVFLEYQGGEKPLLKSKASSQIPLQLKRVDDFVGVHGPYNSTVNSFNIPNAIPNAPYQYTNLNYDYLNNLNFYSSVPVQLVSNGFQPWNNVTLNALFLDYNTNIPEVANIESFEFFNSERPFEKYSPNTVSPKSLGDNTTFLVTWNQQTEVPANALPPGNHRLTRIPHASGLGNRFIFPQGSDNVYYARGINISTSNSSTSVSDPNIFDQPSISITNTVLQEHTDTYWYGGSKDKNDPDLFTISLVEIECTYDYTVDANTFERGSVTFLHGASIRPDGSSAYGFSYILYRQALKEFDVIEPDGSTTHVVETKTYELSRPSSADILAKLKYNTPLSISVITDIVTYSYTPFTHPNSSGFIHQYDSSTSFGPSNTGSIPGTTYVLTQNFYGLDPSQSITAELVINSITPEYDSPQ